MLAKNTSSTGKRGEHFASLFLVKKGYKIISKNINFSNQEVDVIATLDKKYFIVEVKTSSYYSKNEPEDYMNARKLKNLKKAAYSFSRKNNIKMEIIYFDLIAVRLDKNVHKAKIKHYKNIC